MKQWHLAILLAVLTLISGLWMPARADQAKVNDTINTVGSVVDGTTGYSVISTAVNRPDQYEFIPTTTQASSNPASTSVDLFINTKETAAANFTVAQDPSTAGAFQGLLNGQLKKIHQPPAGGAGVAKPPVWAAKVLVPPQLVIWAVNRDDPAATWDGVALLPIVTPGSTTTTPGIDPPVYQPVYAGGTTGDLVKFEMKPAPAGATYAWTATRTAPASPAVAKTFNDGAVWKIDTFNWLPGNYTVECAVMAGGVATKNSASLKVGVRTDDVVVIGWIDPNPLLIPLVTDGVQKTLQKVLPKDGITQKSSMLAKLQASLLFNYCAKNSVDSSFSTKPLNRGLATLLGGFVGLVGNEAVGNHFAAFSEADRKYTLCWMFKYGANTPPSTNGGATFLDDSKHFSEAKLQAFINLNPAHTYFKLLNHFQTKFLIYPNTSDPVMIDQDNLKLLQHEVVLGNTQDPSHLNDLGLPQSVLNLLSTLAGAPDYPANGVFPGQTTGMNGHTAATAANGSIVSQCNEGSPDQVAMDAFTHLYGSTVDFTIWSKINFFSDLTSYKETISPTTGQSLTRKPMPTMFSQGQINTQLYPTYWIYINGEKPTIQVQNGDPLSLVKNKDHVQ